MKQMIISIIFMMVFLLCALEPSSAQTNVSLSNCLMIAENANPDFLKARKKIDESRMKIIQNGAAFLPSLNLSGFLTSLDKAPPGIDFSSLLHGGPAPDIIGNPLLQYAFQDNFSGTFRASMPLFTGGRNLALLETSIHEVAMNIAQLQIVRSQLKLDVIRSFYGIIVNGEMKSLAEETITQLQRRVTLVSNLFSAGTTTDYDLLKTRVLLSSWSARLVEYTKNLNSSQNRLSYLLGYPIEKKISPEGRLEEPLVTMETQFSQKTEWGALEKRPELVVSDRLMKIGKENVRLKLAAVLPQASLQFDQNYLNKKKDPSLDESDWRNWWDIRLGVSWDVFSFGRKAADLNQARLELKEKQLDLSSLRERIRMDVQDAWYDLQQAKCSLESARKNHELAELALKLAVSKRASGTITEVDEFDSRLGEVDARVQVMKSIFDMIMSSAQYDKALGK